LAWGGQGTGGSRHRARATGLALISRTRYEWTLFDYRIWFARPEVGVPGLRDLVRGAARVDPGTDAGGPGAAVAEGPRRNLRPDRPRPAVTSRSCANVWSIDGNAVDVLTSLGADISDAELETRADHRDRRSTWPTILYTSGTTGRPKGCMPHPRQLHDRG